MLVSLYPALSQHAAHPATAMYIRMGAPLEMVTSPADEWSVCECFSANRIMKLAHVIPFAGTSPRCPTEYTVLFASYSKAAPA
eukprot:3397508-Pleurochrysis_carterae.AAC.5